MAPIKRTSSASATDHNVLHQLNEIRRDVIAVQRSLVRIEANSMAQRNRQQRSTPPATAITTPRPSRARTLLNEIANRETVQTICWYHKTYGAAADPKNCQGCGFIAPPRIIIPPRTKPKSKIAPIPVAGKENQPQQPTPVPAADINMDWNEMAHNPSFINPVPADPVDDLADDFADLSD